jgi:hypothetical protein
MSCKGEVIVGEWLGPRRRAMRRVEFGMLGEMYACIA